MNNYERVQQAIDFMEMNLAESIYLEQVAEAAFFSLPHFYRLFHALVGRTVKDYLRLRRLSAAALEIISGKESVLEIALRYQFGSPESFARAFREAWGTNPSEVRRTGQLPAIFAKIDLLREYFSDDHCIPEPSIKVVRYLGPFQVAYCHKHGENSEPEAWDTLVAWANRHGVIREESPARFFGFRVLGPQGNEASYAYEAWIAVDLKSASRWPLPEHGSGVGMKDWSGGMYAVSKAYRPTIGAAWKDMYTWQRLGRYTLGGHQWLEEYVSPPGPRSTGMEVDLYLPLVDRTERGRIIVSGNKGNKWVQSVEVVELEPMKVAYCRAVGEVPETQAFGMMKKWALGNGLSGTENRLFGFNNPDPTPGSPIYGYEVWLTVDDGIRASGDVRVKGVPGGRYAVGTTVPLFQGHIIPLAWQEVGNWVRETGHMMGHHQWLEEHVGFPADGDNPFAEGLVLRLYCPIT